MSSAVTGWRPGLRFAVVKIALAKFLAVLSVAACSRHSESPPDRATRTPSVAVKTRVFIESSTPRVPTNEILKALEGQWRLSLLDGSALPKDAVLVVDMVHRAAGQQFRFDYFDCILDLKQFPSPGNEPRSPQTLRTPALIEFSDKYGVQLNFGKGFAPVFERGSNVGDNAFAINSLTADELVVGIMVFERIGTPTPKPITFCEQRLDADVTHLTCDDSSRPDVDLASLAGLRKLQSLELRLYDGAIAGAQILGNFTELHSLTIERARISDVSSLRNVKHLEHLILEDTDVSDVSALAELTSLRVLNLSGSKVADLRPLEKLAQLRELDLGNLPATDISVIRGLSDLESLELINTKFTSAAPIFKLKKLKRLNAVSAHLNGVLPAGEIDRLEKFEEQVRLRQ
jgi:hypothetical protein